MSYWERRKVVAGCSWKTPCTTFANTSCIAEQTCTHLLYCVGATTVHSDSSQRIDNLKQDIISQDG
jgi:hypothetical protein